LIRCIAAVVTPDHTSDIGILVHALQYQFDPLNLASVSPSCPLQRIGRALRLVW
jgi:hypothetical protein